MGNNGGSVDERFIYLVVFTYYEDSLIKETVWAYSTEEAGRQRQIALQEMIEREMVGVPIIGLRLYGLPVDSDDPGKVVLQ